jgi:xylulokinase
MLCGLADAVDALRHNGVAVDRVLLIGGAAASRAVQAVAPEVFGLPVVVPAPGRVRREGSSPSGGVGTERRERAAYLADPDRDAAGAVRSGHRSAGAGAVRRGA